MDPLCFQTKCKRMTERCQRKIKQNWNEERHIVFNVEARKPERERGRRGDYLRENGENVTVDETEIESRPSCV